MWWLATRISNISASAHSLRMQLLFGIYRPSRSWACHSEVKVMTERPQKKWSFPQTESAGLSNRPQAVHLEAELELPWPEVLWHFTILGIVARLWLLVILNSVHDSFRVLDMPLASWKPRVLVVAIFTLNPKEERSPQHYFTMSKAWNSQVTFHTPNSIKMQRKRNRRSMRLEKLANLPSLLYSMSCYAER